MNAGMADPYLAAGDRTFGWGLPSSGAVAMSAAYRVTPRGAVWDDIRAALVEYQLHVALGDGFLDYGEAYRAHAEVYERSGVQPFIDTAHFFLATHVTPLLDLVGMGSDGFTRLSILVFNNPTDTVFVGWCKRTALGLAELGFPPTIPIGLYALIFNSRSALRAARR